MPIEEQTRSIDFSWRFNHRQGQSEVAYQLRLHQTPELGSTVSFLDPNGEISFSLPASFLNEVYEHISKYEEGTPKIARTSRTVPAVPAVPALEQMTETSHAIASAAVLHHPACSSVVTTISNEL